MNPGLYINGEWRQAHSPLQIEIINPATEALIQQVADADAQDIDDAVQAAHQAFYQGPWGQTSGRQRAAYLRAFAAEITKDIEAFTELEVADNGKPYPEAKWDIEDSIGTFDFYASLADTLDDQQQQIELPDDRFHCQVSKQAVGVTAAIIPWNFPLLMAAWKIAPALAAGCTVVLKPSEVTPLTALKLGDIATKIGLPKGVLNIVSGAGEAGKALAEHPQVSKVAFTGSVPTGSKIMQAAARDIKNISLELGGKSPFIVFADSDLEAAVEWILFGIFWNQGQVCSATSRVLVEQSLYPKLLQRLKTEAEKITIGDGMQEGVLLGPLVNAKQYQMVKQAIARGIEEGATLFSGGQAPAEKEQGYYLQPTIFTDVDTDSWIWQEEIFGPVLCIKAFDSETQAIALANDSKFGLAAAVMSKDQQRLQRVAQQLQAGIIWLNCSQPTFIEAPWGGFKRSGIGRELGEWGLNNYLETKQITQFESNQPWAWYLKPEQ